MGRGSVCSSARRAVPLLGFIPGQTGPADRSFGRAATDAELVALGVGENHPAGPVRLAPIGELDGPKAQCPLDLIVAPGACRPEVEVNSVLGGLAFGYTDEQEAGLAWTFKDEDRVIGVPVSRSDRPSEKVRPEVSKPVRV
jgi:hypothetical protein